VRVVKLVSAMKVVTMVKVVRVAKAVKAGKVVKYVEMVNVATAMAAMAPETAMEAWVAAKEVRVAQRRVAQLRVGQLGCAEERDGVHTLPHSPSATLSPSTAFWSSFLEDRFRKVELVVE
jgi:hypothetical protein